MKKIFISLLLITLVPSIAQAVEMKEFNPAKVLVIVNDKGEVTVREPREIDYKHDIDLNNIIITASDHENHNRSIVQKIFGKGKTCPLREARERRRAAGLE